jgi:hypothetical protein
VAVEGGSLPPPPAAGGARGGFSAGEWPGRGVTLIIHTTIRSIHTTPIVLIVIILTTLTILIVVLYAHIVVLYGAHNTHEAAGLALKHMLHLYIIRLQP